MATAGKHRTQPDASAARVGARIRQLRHDAGFSFDAFVSEVGLGRGYVSELERGLVVPSLLTLERIANALDVTPADLIIGTSTREQLYELTRQLQPRDVTALLAEAAGRAHIAPTLPFRLVEPDSTRLQTNATPLLNLRVDTNRWTAPQAVEVTNWVVVPLRARARKGLFIARVDGDALQPTIANGAYALFQRPWPVARPNELGIFVRWDSETIGRFKVKEYQRRATRLGPGAPLRRSRPDDVTEDEEPFARFVRTLGG